MTGLERIMAAVRLQAPDRVPVIAQVFGHAAVLAGEHLGDYLRDGVLAARCQLRALDRYGYDAVFALLDANVETEAAGSTLEYLSGDYPVVRSYAADTGVDLGSIAVPNPYTDGRMPQLLEAARILRRTVGEEVLVVGCVVGPMTLATQLVGIQDALYLAADDPERFSQLLDLSCRTAIAFGTAQIESGVHVPMVFDPSSSPDVIPPSFYREMVLPHLKRVFAAFKDAGAAAGWLHTAGPVDPILPYYPGAGVDIANIDFCVDPNMAMNTLPQTCIDGNIKPLSFVIDTPDVIASDARVLIKAFADRGGFILSSGCEIPPESAPENIAAMVEAAKRGT